MSCCRVLVLISLCAAGLSSRPAFAQAATSPESSGKAEAYYQFMLGRHLESEEGFEQAIAAYQRAVESLFENEHDPIMVLKWKELLDSLEEITDACEDVANVIEGVVVKHG